MAEIKLTKTELRDQQNKLAQLLKVFADTST